MVVLSVRILMKRCLSLSDSRPSNNLCVAYRLTSDAFSNERLALEAQEILSLQQAFSPQVSAYVPHSCDA